MYVDSLLSSLWVPFACVSRCCYSNYIAMWCRGHSHASSFLLVLRVTLAIMLVNLVNVTELREISEGLFHMYLSSCFQNEFDHEGLNSCSLSSAMQPLEQTVMLCLSCLARIGPLLTWWWSEHSHYWGGSLSRSILHRPPIPSAVEELWGNQSPPCSHWLSPTIHSSSEAWPPFSCDGWGRNVWTFPSKNTEVEMSDELWSTQN